MREVSLFCQQRRDGGVRFGVTVDKSTMLHYFRGASLEPDPALDWWIDIVVEGDELPSHPDLLREWFITHIDALKLAIAAAAQQLASGVDTGIEPFHTAFRVDSGLSFEIFVSAVRALTGQRIAERLRDFAAELESIFGHLETMVAA